MLPPAVARAASPPGAAFNPRRLTVALGASQLLSWATTFYLPAVVTGAAARDLRASPVEILGAFSVALLVSGLCAPRIGRWIDRHGGRGALAASTVVMALGLVLLAVSTSLAVWYAGWIVLGAGMALGLYDAAFATAGTLLGPAVGPVLTGVTLIAGFASTLGWPAGTALLGALGWRSTLLVYAAAQIALNLPLILAVVPRHAPMPHQTAGRAAAGGGHARGRIIGCLAGFFAIRWFITSAIAAHVLPLLGGLGLSAREAVVAAMLLGPGQVAGRLLEWALAGRIGPLARARLGAMLFPVGALALLWGGPVAAGAFTLCYGMSNGILTINRGTLPMLVLGPAGYAGVLGWLAVPVLLAQAAAPTLATPMMAALSSTTWLLAAAGVAALAVGLLLPLRPWQEGA